jgi:hypothetical protein
MRVMVAAIIVAGGALAVLAGLQNGQLDATQLVQVVQSWTASSFRRAAGFDQLPRPMRGAVTQPVAETPTAAAELFLRAIQRGDSEAAFGMLTSAAKSAARQGRVELTALGSDTATFRLEDVAFVGELGAHVDCLWSERPDAASVKLVLLERKEEHGWRVAALAIDTGSAGHAALMNLEEADELVALSRFESSALVPSGDATQ